MSSSEEYLDNLLKSLTEGGNNANLEMSQETMRTENLQGTPVEDSGVPEEFGQSMSMDDIEAMFASMGAESKEEESTSDDAVLQDEMIAEAELLPDESVAEEESLPDGLALDDGLTIGDEMLPDGLAPDDGLTLGDEMLPDGLALDDGLTLGDEMLPDGLALDDGLTLGDEMLPDGLAPDDGLAIGDEMLPDGLALDDGLTLGDEMLPDGLEMDDELMLGDELALEEESLGELVLEESETDDITMEETMVDEFSLDEEMLSEESPLDESMSDDLSLDELGLDELGLGDLGLEEAGQDEEDLLALDDTDSEPDALDDFALAESEEDDSDLSALLASMGGDEDLSEINDLLEKSDQGVELDDDMMAMLDSVSDGEEGEDSFDFFGGEESVEGDPEKIREITPEELAGRENPKTKKQKKKEEKERKKKEKQAKKKKGSRNENTDDEGADELSDLMAGMSETDEKPKKQGIFAKFIDFLLEEDDDSEDNAAEARDDGAVIGNLSEENQELLAELRAEDQKNAKKKDKKDKKDKKGKKSKKKAGEAGEEGDEGEEIKAKPKKPKKEKKKKEKNIEDEPKVPEKKLSKKKVMSVFLFCATIAACIIIVTILLPEQMDKQEARMAYDQSQYSQVYELLYGKELSEEDEILFKKSRTILQIQRKLDSYENYKKIDMQLEALNALIEGISRYQDLKDNAELYNVSGEVADIYWQILDALANDYGLSEADALDIISSGDDVTYSQRLQSVISGEVYGTEEEDVPEGKQDVLPEEEEIIDRLEGTGTE